MDKNIDESTLGVLSAVLVSHLRRSKCAIDGISKDLQVSDSVDGRIDMKRV